ncbi:hypothetical protein SFV1gp03 [Sulfolobus filamentous virus 1]|uniref:Uncharacterized protein n=1 Tax=Sulfolobus filamentous virus 1 TaxID=2304198 RepID=A0A346LU42_SUFV1|nr:hypothetical protein HOT91_gp03 [Sulfolobus filamentous virus 1]AXQ00085.1 hypothetical protein SFV1gp03 [Sulfolobus filamentous virus 1]
MIQVEFQVNKNNFKNLYDIFLDYDIRFNFKGYNVTFHFVKLGYLVFNTGLVATERLVIDLRLFIIDGGSGFMDSVTYVTDNVNFNFLFFSVNSLHNKINYDTFILKLLYAFHLYHIEVTLDDLREITRIVRTYLVKLLKDNSYLTP